MFLLPSATIIDEPSNRRKYPRYLLIASPGYTLKGIPKKAITKIISKYFFILLLLKNNAIPCEFVANTTIKPRAILTFPSCSGVRKGKSS